VDNYADLGYVVVRRISPGCFYIHYRIHAW
jgi:hypothetical protein